MVIGASGWFYLLTAETRSFAYIPAIVTGGGTSIMFVTTLALAAEFVDADKVSTR
jgi:Na+/melibiose symporter-like transporter